jgi:hypothetical protein
MLFTPPHLLSSITICQSQTLHQTPYAADHYHPLSALPPSSSTSYLSAWFFFLDHYTLRKKGILQEVRTYTPTDTVPHPRKTEHSRFLEHWASAPN